MKAHSRGLTNSRSKHVKAHFRGPINSRVLLSCSLSPLFNRAYPSNGPNNITVLSCSLVNWGYPSNKRSP